MIYAVAVLFTSLAIVEVLVMLLLEKLAIQGANFWVEAFIDASAVAITAMLVVRYLFKSAIIQLRRDINPESLQFESALIVFGVEAMLMLVLSLVPFDVSTWQTIVVDTAAFALLSTAGIYLWVLLPAKSTPSDRYGTAEKLNTYWVKYLSAYLFGMVLFLLFLFNIYNQQKQSYEAQLIERETQQLILAKEAFVSRLSQAALDVLTLAQQQDLKEHLGGDITAIYELELDYLNMAKIKQSYEQIRFISASGQEEVRVNRDSKIPTIIARKELQNKQLRYYFQLTSALNMGEVFISPMDLNVEHDQIEIPYKPIVRVATPVVNTFDDKLGIVIINLNASRLLRLLDKAAATVLGDIMLLNEDGYWLHGPEPDSLWAFMFPERQDLRIQKQFADAWQTIKNNNAGVSKNKHGHFVFQTVELKADQVVQYYDQTQVEKELSPHWPVLKLVSFIPPETFDRELVGKRRLLSMFFLLAGVVIGIGTLMYDRTQIRRQQAEIKIKHLAHHDSLTGLCNRLLFMEQLELQLAHTRRQGKPLALMYLDLDRFKPINDELGHEAGDSVLKEVAKRLGNIMRESDTLARLGGDEFSVILPDPGNHEQVATVAQRILDAFNQPFYVLEHQCSVGISIGIALYQGKTQSLDALIHEADQAMYSAKQAGRNCYRFAAEQNVS